MKKAILILAIIAMTASLAVAGTLAWFTGKASVTNTFNAGSVDVAIYENENEEPVDEEGLTFDDFVPGDTKEKVVTFENTGKSDAYIRAKATASWDPQLDASNIIIDYNTEDWVLGSDDWYYYDGILGDGILGSGDVTSPFFNTVYFQPGEDDNNYQNAVLTVQIDVEAIQAANDAAENAWSGFPFGDDSGV